MVSPSQFLEESDQGRGRGGKDTCSAPQLYNLSHDKTSVPINPDKQTNDTYSAPRLYNLPHDKTSVPINLYKQKQTIPAQLLPESTRAHAVERNMVRSILINPHHIPPLSFH